MDSLRHPVGTLSPSVYWRRRVLVLVAFLAVLALILYACSGSSPKKSPVKPVASGTPSAGGAAGGTTSGAATTGGTTSGGTSGTAGATGGASASGGTSAAGGTSGTAGATAGSTGAVGAATGTTGGTAGGTTGTAGAAGGTAGTSTCLLTLALTTQAPAYANGEQPAFSVAVGNKGTADCTADLGPKSLILTVFSGQDRIWSSADCDGKQDLRAVPPGGIQQIPFTWTRVRSQPGCAGSATTAAFGTYYAQVSLATGTGPTAASFSSSQQSFQLKTGS